MLENLNKETDFKEKIERGTVLVDFFATWCGPCKMLGPVLENYVKNNRNIKIIKVDIDQFPNLAREYSIMSVPTLLVFKNGKLENKKSGFMSNSELDQLVR